MGGVSSLYECIYASRSACADLDRTPWHMTLEACDRSAPVVRSTGARVSERVAGGAIPDFSKTSPAPRLPAVPSRESPLEPRPVGTVPECVPPWRHTLGEDSPAYGNVSRAGDGCGGVVVCTKRRRDHCRSPMIRDPVTADGRAAPLRVARRRAAPPPDDY